MQTVVTGVNIYTISIFALEFDFDSIVVLSASSLQECYEFIERFVSIKIFWVCIPAAAALYASVYCIWKTSLKRTWLLYAVAVLLIMPQAINTIRFIRSGDYEDIYNSNTAAVLISSGIKMSHAHERLIRMSAEPELPSGIKNNLPEGKFLTLLVIGESATRYHHSIYGYPRDTSPELSKMNRLLVFQDVISGYAHTIQALRYMLTTAEKEDFNDLRYSVFDIFKKAGFKTAFISNQSRWGEYDTPITIMTANADKRIYTRELDFAGFDRICFEYADKVIDGITGPSAVVMQLYGSHGSYDRRTPDDMKIFTASCGIDYNYPVKDYQEIADYDSSIRYTDLLLGEMLSKLQSLPYPAICIYVSDHGEWPSAPRGRSGASTDPACYEVPFTVYANDAYHRIFPDFMKNATANISKPYMTDYLNYAVLSASGITFDGFPYNKDIFSPTYQSGRKRFMGESAREYIYRPNPYKLRQK